MIINSVVDLLVEDRRNDFQPMKVYKVKVRKPNFTGMRERLNFFRKVKPDELNILVLDKIGDREFKVIVSDNLTNPAKVYRQKKMDKYEQGTLRYTKAFDNWILWLKGRRLAIDSIVR